MQSKNTTNRVIGIVPARMAASRFPGKPMHPILGRPMLEHVQLRAAMYEGWSELAIATCDAEIESFAKSRNFSVIMTGSHHTRALDRVAEAVTKLSNPVKDEDIVVCVQGDEPMMRPDMISTVIAPILESDRIHATILAMHIVDKDIWLNSDTVKLVYNASGEVLYTSRAPVPFCKGEFTPEFEARRIYGIFAFQWKYLRAFTEHDETRLERLEACDSNRILDMGFRQHIAPYPNLPSFSVDSPQDIGLVERHMQSDPLWQKYR